MVAKNSNSLQNSIKRPCAPNKIVSARRGTFETDIEPNEFATTELAGDFFRDQQTISRYARAKAVLRGQIDDLKKVLTQKRFAASQAKPKRAQGSHLAKQVVQF